MKLLGLTAVALAALLAISQPAHAKDVNANKTNVVGALAAFNPTTCGHIGKLKHTIRRAPKHGRIDVVHENATISEGKCAGKKALFTFILYTPNRGYRGKDAATVILRYPHYLTAVTSKSKYFRLNLNVK